MRILTHSPWMCCDAQPFAGWTYDQRWLRVDPVRRSVGFPGVA